MDVVVKHHFDGLYKVTAGPAAIRLKTSFYQPLPCQVTVSVTICGIFGDKFTQEAFVVRNTTSNYVLARFLNLNIKATNSL